MSSGSSLRNNTEERVDPAFVATLAVLMCEDRLQGDEKGRGWITKQKDKIYRSGGHSFFKWAENPFTDPNTFTDTNSSGSQGEQTPEDLSTLLKPTQAFRGK